MAVDIREFADLPHADGELARQKIEHTFVFEFVCNHRRRDVIESPTLGSTHSIEWPTGSNAGLPFSALGFERHGLCVVRI